MGTRTQQPSREDDDDDLPSGPGATTISGQSVSMSGSVGSPSSRSEQTMATPASDNTFLRLNNLDIHGDEAGSQGPTANVKKKRGQRAVGGDKSGRGLRQFSMKVCEKVESKGRTTYNEVADELVAEFADPGNSVASPDQQQQYDEKNIRRRVYDALNVLMAMDIISKDKKEIQWKGLPRTSVNDIEELKAERLGLRNRIEKKAAYLQELEEQYVGLQNLIQRNEQLFSSENAPSGGVSLPFILVQTRPHATVEIEISEDMQLVHFDFNSTPFELHDDNYVLKAMKFCNRPQCDNTAQNFTPDGGEGSSMSGMYQPPHMPIPSLSNTPVRTPTSPPLPGIIKARVKHEH
ncbi:transcription factor-like protein DPB isoform X1 [Cucumis melo]|uniref:Transcription factor-like protein DPB isoform X1 n=1 Tax=Cucumis melo TaxID=3656 RepID=A0A1S3C1D5_CUCME|nr:transcription factor-like protein DPB isoform X1 [Cucumis melo]